MSKPWVWPLFLGIGIGIGLVVSFSTDLPKDAPAGPARDADPAAAQAPGGAAFSRPFIETVRKVQPAVVQINVVSRVRVRQWDPFASFFDDDFSSLFRRRFQDRIVEQPKLGSGVIVDPKGYILTNNHVVDGASEISVLLHDGRSIMARLIGQDPLTDLALVQIREQGLKPVSIGDSDAVQVGEWVLAVGSPMGFSNTVTEGIVSATGRRSEYSDYGAYQNFIQTSAPINPGNSGGPLVNLDGEVIGINTAIASYTGQSAGIGFATPANLAREVMDAIVADGYVKRGWLGIVVEAAREGVRVTGRYQRSPAASSLRDGDLIVSYEGRPVPDPDSLIRRIFRTEPGDKAALVIRRGGEEIRFSVKIAAHPKTPRE